MTNGVLNIGFYGNYQYTVNVSKEPDYSPTDVTDQYGQFLRFDENQFNSIQINGGSAALTTNILSNDKPLHLVGGPNGGLVYLGDGNGVRDIQGTITLENPPNYNSVSVYDFGDHTARTVTLHTVTINGAAYGQISGLAPAVINYKYADTSSLTVVGSDAGGTFNVLATGPVTTSIDSGNARTGTTVNVGRAGSVQGIGDQYHPLYINTHFSTVYIDNSSDSHSRTVSQDSVVFDGANYGEISGLAPGNIYYSYLGTSAITVHTGGGTDTVNVHATGVPLTIDNDGGGGNDIVTLGANGNAQGIRGAVTVYNGPSYTHVNIDNSAEGSNHNHTVTIGSAGVRGLTPADVNFTSYSVNTLNVLGGRGNNTYTITATPATTLVGLNTGAGVDTVNVQGAGPAGLAILTGGNDVVNLGSNGTLAGLTGPVTVVASAPIHNFPTVHVNDSGDDASHPNVVLSNSSLTGLTSPQAPINFVQGPLGLLTINGGRGNTTYTITGGAPALSTTLNTGSGVDTINVQTAFAPLTVNSASGSGADVIALGDRLNRLAFITSAVTVNAAATDSLVLNDQGVGGNRTYAVTPTTVTWSPGRPLLTYSGLKSLTVNGSRGFLNTFDLSAGTSATAAVTLNGGGLFNKLIGANAGNFWEITGADAGTLSGAAYPQPVSFTHVRSLTAGSGGDTFRFNDGATLSGSVTGGGSDTLDYSPYSTSVVVDLQTGSATGVASGVSGIRNVIGGSGGAAGTYNLLIGAGGDTLTGGSGPRSSSRCDRPGLSQQSRPERGAATLGWGRS
jgi:hypothetical protein